MAFLFVMPNHIDHQTDDKGGTTVLRVNCSELSPRNFNVNLIKHPASVLQQFEAFAKAKQPVMIPIKEGTTSDGSPYFQLLPGQIIPVSLDYVKSLQDAQSQTTSASSISNVNPVKELDSADSKESEKKPSPLFSSSKTANG